MINSYIKEETFSQKCLWAAIQAEPEPPLSLTWFASTVSDNWICLERIATTSLCFYSTSLRTGIASVFIFSLTKLLLRGCVFGLFELYSFQFLTDLGLLPDHCSTSRSLGLLLTQCWTSLKELGRQSLSMMLASWLWFHHLCSAEIYNWLLQLGKVKYPFRSPSQKG